MHYDYNPYIDTQSTYALSTQEVVYLVNVSFLEKIIKNKEKIKDNQIAQKKKQKQQCCICLLSLRSSQQSCIHLLQNKFEDQRQQVCIQIQTNGNRQIYKERHGEQQNSMQNNKKQCIINIRLPLRYQFFCKELPKSMMQKISQSQSQSQSQPSEINNLIRQIKVEQLQINPYIKKGTIQWFLYKIPLNKIQKIQILIKQQNNISLKEITYFINIKQYNKYFNFTQQKIQKEIKNLHSNQKNKKYFLYGLYHQSNQNSIKAYIDVLYLWIYQLHQQYKLVQIIRLKNITHQSTYKTKTQQISSKSNQNQNNICYKSSILQSGSNICQIAQIDNFYSQQHTQIYSQQMVIQMENLPCLNLPWESKIDLQYKLRHLQQRLGFFQNPFQGLNKNIQSNFSHYLIRFQLNKNQSYIIVIYNCQRLCYNLFQQMKNRLSLTKFCQQDQNSQQKQQNWNKQWLSTLQRELEWLEEPLGLSYPLDYYITLFLQFNKLQKMLKLQNCLHQLYQHNQNHNFSKNLVKNRNFVQMSLKNKIKLCKYILVQNIKIQSIYEQKNQRYQTDVQITQQLLQNHNFLSEDDPSDKKLSRILCLNNELISSNPISKTIIIYWNIGLPGSLKTSVFGDIKLLLSQFEISILNITDISEKQKIKKFITEQQTFQNQRFTFFFVDTYFTLEKMQQFTQMLHNILPKQIYYQLFLITPSISEAKIFYSQIDNNKDKNNQQNDTSFTKIETTYQFSIDYMIGCMLNVQKRYYQKENPNNIYAQGTESLAKMLHYISRNYSNMDLQKTVNRSRKARGKIKILPYHTKQKIQINWENLNEYEKQQIQDQLRVLLQLSYKNIIEQDMLLAYFLQNLENLEYNFNMETLGDEILERTFIKIPYFV